MRGAMSLAVILCSLGGAGCSDVLGIQDLQSGNGGGGGGGDDGGITITPPAPHIAIRGLLTNEDDSTPISTRIEALDANLLDHNVLASTNAVGAFELDIPYNGGAPIDVVVHALAPSGDMIDTYQFFPTPISDDQELLFGMYSLATLQMFATTAGVPFNAAFTMAEFNVIDANGIPQSGEILTVSPGGETTYAKTPGGGPAMIGSLAATGIDGMAWAFNVTPGALATVAIDGAPTRTYASVPGGVYFVPAVVP